jgi:hypothetical protein
MSRRITQDGQLRGTMGPGEVGRTRAASLEFEPADSSKTPDVDIYAVTRWIQLTGAKRQLNERWSFIVVPLLYFADVTVHSVKPPEMR